MSSCIIGNLTPSTRLHDPTLPQHKLAHSLSLTLALSPSPDPVPRRMTALTIYNGKSRPVVSSSACYVEAEGESGISTGHGHCFHDLHVMAVRLDHPISVRNENIVEGAEKV